MFFSENESIRHEAYIVVLSKQWPLEEKSKRGSYKRFLGVSAEPFSKELLF